MVDLSKLPRAPWKQLWNLDSEEPPRWPSLCDSKNMCLGIGFDDDEPDNLAMIQFIVLARNAFDGDPEALAWWEENRNKRGA